jgi:hypothetical protein
MAGSELGQPLPSFLDAAINLHFWPLVLQKSRIRNAAPLADLLPIYSSGDTSAVKVWECKCQRGSSMPFNPSQASLPLRSIHSFQTHHVRCENTRLRKNAVRYPMPKKVV